jgi:hypothetical protein
VEVVVVEHFVRGRDLRDEVGHRVLAGAHAHHGASVVAAMDHG